MSMIPKVTRSLRVKPLYIDKTVIVVNKPAGIITQLSKENENLEASTDDYLQLLQSELELEEKPWPVHRLDKPTTGAFLLARTQKHLHSLHTQFKTHEVQKTYLALVRGGDGSFPGSKGVLKDAFRYGPDGKFDRIMPIGAEKRVPSWERGRIRLAETHWELLATSPKAPLSLVRLNLITGTKHQLRIHMAKLLSVPILGDSVYTGKVATSSLSKIAYVPKDLFLHASHISFTKYREAGGHKRYRLGITAPLTRNFRHMCAKFEIPMDPEVIHGGVFIDGVSVNGEQELLPGARWLHGFDSQID